MDPTQGNGAPEAPQADGAKTIAEADVIRIVNAAISSRYKAQDAKFDKWASEFGAQISSKLDEAFAAKKPESPQSSDKPSSIEEHPQFKGMQKQLEELRKQSEAVKAERDAERAKTRDQALRAKVSSALAEVGINGKHLKHAEGFLVDASKSVRYADDGDGLTFNVNGEDLDFATGLKTWVASDDAKIYLPPRGAAGSGEKPNNSAARGNAPPDARENLGSLLAQHLAR